MLLKRRLIVILFFLITFSGKSQDIVDMEFGNGLVNTVARDSSFSVKFGARFQSLFTSAWSLSDPQTSGSPQTNFLIRRSRLKFSGFALSPALRYKLELGLSNRDISGANPFTGKAPRYILDAVLKWNFHENFVLWAGQTKLPGNRERVISSGDLQLVDRSILNKHFNIDRDMGIQLHHYFILGKEFTVKEIVSLAQGEGRNIMTGNLGGFQYTGRLEILPWGEFQDYQPVDFERLNSPKLALGLSYDYNNNSVRTRSNSGSFMQTDSGFFETDIKTIFVDAMFKYSGISFMGEYAKRKAKNPIAVNSDGSPTGDVVSSGEGLNLQMGYLFKNNYEIVGRYSQLNPKFDTYKGIEQQYTLGFSKYVVGHNLKIQTDISLNDLYNKPSDQLMYRLQIDFHL
ncbi:porin [Salegentibacter sp. F14]